MAPHTLPIAPRPKPDELISSWLGRTAACYDLDGDQLRHWLAPSGQVRHNRPDWRWDRDELMLVAACGRLAPATLDGLDLARAWPRLRTDWLPQTGGAGRARSAVDLSWCWMCLAEGHAAGGAYLDRETALPLIFCHRHAAWRQDYCRHCSPRKAPRFVFGAPLEFVCTDCGVPLRRTTWPGPRPPFGERTKQTDEAMSVLLAFERQVRKALLGEPAYLIGVGRVTSRQMLSVIADLTWVLLAPQRDFYCLMNTFACPCLPLIPTHRPWRWDPDSYQELSPLWRAWVLSAIVAIFAPERTSRLMSGQTDAREPPSNLEWVLQHADVRMQAVLVRGSVRWPVRLQSRVAAHQLATRLDVDGWLRRLELARARDNEPIMIG